MEPSPGRIRRRWRRGRCVLLGLATTISMVAVAPAAGAEVVQDAVTGVVVHTDGGPATQSVAIQGIYPGSQHETIFFFDGGRTETVQTVAIGVTNVRDFENDCNRPERNTADPTCGGGDDQGELSGFLEVAVASGVEQVTAGARSCALTGAPVDNRLLNDATDMVVVRPPTLADDASMCVVARFRHAVRGSSDNLTQTDRVLFDLELRFEGDEPTGNDVDPDEAGVGGISVDSPRTLVPSTVVPRGGTINLGLAATGAPVMVLLGIALGLVGVGVLVRALARGGTA